MATEHLPPRVQDLLADSELLDALADQHGTGSLDDDLNGNLQHLLSPLVGMLALDVRVAPEPTGRDVHMLSRLTLALALLVREQVSREVGDTVPDWPSTLTGVETLPVGGWMCATATFTGRPPVRGFGRTAVQAEVEAWKAYVQARDEQQP